MTEQYRRNLDDALEFQDFAVCELYKRGIVVSQLGSRKYQLETGESLSGFEIKFDRKFRKTGNLYFEYMEKSSPENLNYVASGFLRTDNTWMWVIGDYEELWLVPRESLKRLYEECVTVSGYANERNIRAVTTATSKGMLVPVEFVTENLCAKHLEITTGDE